MVDLHCTLHTDKNQKEITRHGSVLFPVACYEDDMACTGVPIHWHDEFEYILAFNGTIHLHVGTEPITLRQGAGILINAGVCTLSRIPFTSRASCARSSSIPT